jgi:hypothetical protein
MCLDMRWLERMRGNIGRLQILSHDGVNCTKTHSAATVYLGWYFGF